MASKRIIVPLDGSQLAEAALPWAERLAVATNAQIVAFRAAEAHVLPGMNTGEGEVHALEAAQKYLNDVVARLTARGLKAWPITAYGRPEEHIAEAARVHDAAIIVMATHGRSGPGRWLFGGVADKVVRRATVPVLVVRARQSPARPWCRLVVPLDGSPQAEQALAAAADLARALGLEIVLLQVVEPRMTRIVGEALIYSSEAIPQDKAAAYQYLDEIAKRLRKRGIAVSTAVEVGVSGEGAATYARRPGETITSYVKENAVDLIAMCGEYRSGLSHLLLGSVVGDVLHGADVPVLLMNPRCSYGSAIDADGAAIRAA